MWLPLWLGCVPEVPVEEGPSSCDGKLQAEEGLIVDSLYDLDQDGYYDADEPSCELNYGANRLDCDDGDLAISPASQETPCNGVDDDCNPDTPDEVDLDEDGSPACEDCNDRAPELSPEKQEVCWDLIDNDCSGITDENCGIRYAGTFSLDRNVRYNCLATTVKIDFADVKLYQFDAETATLSVDGDGTTPSGGLDGGFREQVDFWFQTVENYAGCTQTYTFSGTFDDEDHFVADFEARFNGAFACLNCQTRRWEGLVGTRTSTDL